jgi:hypothetical protein
MHRSSSRFATALVVSVVAVTAPIAIGEASATVVEPPAAGASAEVIAQGLVTFGEGEFHWEVATLAVGQTPAPVGSEAAGFLLSRGPVAVLVSAPGFATWRLGADEAVFRLAGPTSSAVALGEGAAALTAIAIAADSGPGGFTPGSGVRDVDLVRGHLDAESSLVVHAEVSAVAYVVDGQVSVNDTTVSVGTTTTGVGDVTITNEGVDRATVVVAMVGASVDPAAAAPDVSTPPAPAPEPPTDASASIPPQSAPSPTTAASVTDDNDQDGLSAADEELRGTDPDDSDSDDDRLTDGFEVFESGTDPTNADTDGDGGNDGDEIDAGTNPNTDANSDDDGDGLTAAEEDVRGTDPGVFDTDSDGLSDGYEVSVSGSNPTLANTDGDEVPDGVEVEAGIDPNSDGDSDGDSIPDSDEVASGTNPFDPDDPAV